MTADEERAQAPDDRCLEFDEVFRDELQVVLPALSTSEGQTANAVQHAVDRHPEELSALCLSGGGIRSATFALGVLQGFARFGLLQAFHYLSTVSGGGYIGSWLSAWRKYHSDEQIFRALNAIQEEGKDPPQIRGIRADSNYITPRLGLLSLDTWTVLTLYLRNLILNWLIFAPLFLGCALFPAWWGSVLVWTTHHPGPGAVAHYLWLGLGCVLLTVGLGCAIYGRFRMSGDSLTRGRFLKRVLVPLVASSIAFCIAAHTRPKLYAVRYDLTVGALLGFLTYFTAWFFARVVAHPSTEEKSFPRVATWVLSGAVVGVIMTLILRVMETHPALNARAAVPNVVLGLSGGVGAYLVGDILYVGASSLGRRGEMDREWLARAAGWLASVSVIWGVYSTLTLYGPVVLSDMGPVLRSALAAVGGASGLLTLLIGWSAKTAATPPGAAQCARAAVGAAGKVARRVPMDLIVSIAAVVFAVILIVLFAALGQVMVSRAAAVVALLQPWIGGEPFPFFELIIIAALIGLAILISAFVNVNRFSLHALYRNRIVRAFIGSARAGKRSPDPFTGFDQGDNLSFSRVVPQSHPDRLFHVVNAALNVVDSENPAWQERKAESFVFTRLHSGNPYVGFRRSEYYATHKEFCGITLGTATAISGAAVSPNQGYHSSPLVGLLLMLFNVRLGWWLGTPRAPTYDREGPALGFRSVIRELSGTTTDKGQWIYLSDGGHFENLGLYEMIRRRCRFIVVSDAGCDPDFTFEDLGNAARKAFIDFGVSIRFRKLQLQPRQNPPTPGARFAIGTITYPGSDRPGWLLYIKPTYQATESVDVRSYASQHAGFPHESTADQWFSESQLESYRALGAYILEDICTAGAGVPPGTKPDPMTLAQLKAATKKYADRLESLQVKD